MAFLFAILMWGVVYQGYNAVFPAFYQELFPTKTRVSAFAVSQNIGTLITAFLPTIYAATGRPDTWRLCRGQEVRSGRRRRRPDLPCVGGFDRIQRHLDGRRHHLGLAIIAAIAAFSARETFRIHLNDLGNKNAVPIPREEYERIRSTGVDVPV